MLDFVFNFGVSQEDGISNIRFKGGGWALRCIGADEEQLHRKERNDTATGYAEYGSLAVCCEVAERSFHLWGKLRSVKRA